MIKAITSLNENERDNSLSLFRDSLELDGEAELYDVDIYDHSDNGEVIVKLLLDTELDQNTLAETITVSFDDESIKSSSIEQIQAAYP
tara:strand:- start:1885 stop:2148 length:264 start_codon:yes stop_codon:yes gene_type:complete